LLVKKASDLTFAFISNVELSYQISFAAFDKLVSFWIDSALFSILCSYIW